MTERPILFSAAMVRALLAGTKTQTRRLVKPQFAADSEPVEMGATNDSGHQVSGHSGVWWDDGTGNSDLAIKCPYGQPGDRLWVRETYFAFGRWETRFSQEKGRDEWHFVDLTRDAGKAYGYATDGDGLWPMPGRRKLAGATPGWWKRPAIFMPRAASRITLEITQVRVQRLHAICEADARAEGAPGYEEGIDPPPPDDEHEWSYLASFIRLWKSINGAGTWDANPWVWALSLKAVTP